MPRPRPAPTDLRAFLDRLREAGELVEIEAEVDPRLEMAEVHRRVIAADGPAILFKRPKGAAFPAVTNLFGSAERVRLAFGDRPEELVERIARLPEEALPPTPSKLWAQRDLALSLARVGLKRGRRSIDSQRRRVPGGLRSCQYQLGSCDRHRQEHLHP